MVKEPTEAKREEVKRQLAAIDDFDATDESAWFLKKATVRADKKRIYVTQNLQTERARPYKFRLAGAEGVLQAAAKSMAADWNTSMLKSHPGFSSFSNTVGDYSGDEQKSYTRVVGPSENSWKLFKSKVRG